MNKWCLYYHFIRGYLKVDNADCDVFAQLDGKYEGLMWKRGETLLYSEILKI